MRSTTARKLTPSSGWFPGLPDALSRAVKAYNLPSKPEWQKVEQLSNRTVFEGIEVFGDSAVSEGGRLVAPATVYITLTYTLDDTTFNESYPARVFFTLDGEQIEIANIEVQTDFPR
jgi:hypothetical protein